MKLKFIGKASLFLAILFSMAACTPETQNPDSAKVNDKGQAVYIDQPYTQDYSIRYYLRDEFSSAKLSGISADRDRHIYILSDKGVLVPDNGRLFYPGKLMKDIAYTPMDPKNIKALHTYQDQTVYLDDHQVFSNAWAGKLQIDHHLLKACCFAAGDDFQFLISDGNQVVYMKVDGTKVWEGKFPGLEEIKFDATNHRFILVSSGEVAAFSPTEEIQSLYKGSNITCAEPFGNSGKIAIGTANGYLIYPENEINTKVPCPEITSINEIDGKLWFGSANGAFRLNENGKYSYYAGERWLPGDQVISVEKGPDNSVLVLTDKGLGQLYFKEMTLEDKAMFFEKQVREKNIRYGFNCSASHLPNGYSSAKMGNQPSDNLWTGMYLASQLFRYKVTGDKEAKENAYEAFEAMERLHTVTGIKGLFARSIERDYKVENTKTKGWKEKELLSGSPARIWMPCEDHPNWTFRSTASSDQAVGQMFALTIILELVKDEDWHKRALTMLDNLMSYIVDNDLYIIDVDGEPTLWGKWNPDYVNSFPTCVGDRKITSSNIISFLQTAYKFTGKEKFKKKAEEMMDKYGYLDNLMRPMEEIGKASEDANLWSQSLSEEWNHSDDEMYFLAYWGLYPYALTPELKEKYREAIRDHWKIERPEKNALWNFCYAMTGAKEFDLDQSIDFLQQYPLDLRNWAVHNSQRQDIEMLPKNFRGQTTKELLPLGEIPLYRHNGQIFDLDRNGNGEVLISAGDVWLLPYWMGRYLGVISAPENH